MMRPAVDSGRVKATEAREPIRILLVDDSVDDADLVVRALRQVDGELVALRVDDATSMQEALEAQPWDVVVCDWTMPQFSGLAAHELLKQLRGDVPFIIASGTCTEEMAIKAMRSGARDWVPKGNLGRLAPAVSRELTKEKERRRNEEVLRRTEERLRQVQKMEAVGGLAAGVAHDFNNILSVILGHADLALGELKDSDPIYESLEEIQAAGQRAADLTRRLLAFSRQQVLQPQLVELDVITSSLEKMLRRLVGEDIELAIIGPDSLGKVLVDPGQMEQVVLNLVVNARDAMPQGGRLTIETANVDLDASWAEEHPGLEAGSHVMLIVRDTGVGMDDATLGRIFEPFFTTKGPGQGTGLGLATVFGIVKQSGGVIVTESELGRGTTFTVYLPRVFASEAAKKKASDPGPGTDTFLGTETILLVEDDDAVRSLVRTILEKHGYCVLVASNGGEALSLSDERVDPIDLLLTDVVMPRMSGRELSDRLVERRPTLKALYMSGYTTDAVVSRGVLEGGISFLQKPVVPNDLLRLVREVLGPSNAPRLPQVIGRAPRR